jgi:hypothetical protein
VTRGPTWLPFAMNGKFVVLMICRRPSGRPPDVAKVVAAGVELLPGIGRFNGNGAGLTDGAGTKTAE